MRRAAYAIERRAAQTPILPSSGWCCTTASSGRPRSSLGCALLSASIYRSITRMCGSGRSSIHNGEGWRCFTVTTTLVTQRAAAHGWMCLSNKVDSARAAPGYLQCLRNYVRPQAGQSALLSWDEVITLFHEFGHTLHGLFAQPALRQSLGDQYAAARFCRISFADLRTLGQPAAGVCPLREALPVRGADAASATRQYVACGNLQ